MMMIVNMCPAIVGSFQYGRAMMDDGDDDDNDRCVKYINSRASVKQNSNFKMRDGHGTGTGSEEVVTVMSHGPYRSVS